jgi:hypothetical protein
MTCSVSERQINALQKSFKGTIVHIETVMMVFLLQGGMTTQLLLLHQLSTVFLVSVVKCTRKQKKQTGIP